ncbi:MAG: hypothetical protein Q8N26_15055 [Myxococcales bacterium]|nr:hypothetical protein [Myxococcales bacterium]
MAALTGWKQLVFGERAGRTALVLGAVVALPFCASGLFMDDYLHQSLLEGLAGLGSGDRWHLFTFATGKPADTRPLIENGPFPWWTLPTLRFSFLRPLTALIANVEHVLVGGNAPLMHLHSIAWYVALIAVVTRLFRRAFGNSLVAPLAGVLFAIDDAHAIAVGWVANRNALISTVFALLAVLAHVRWREDGWRWGLPLSLVAAVLGLAGGESAVAALAYLGAWELTRGPGGVVGRAKALLAMTVVGLGYVALYSWSGSGAAGSEIYIDPLREPLAFFAQAPAKALALTGAQFFGATADLWLVKVALRPLLVLTGVAALIVVIALLRALWSTLSETERNGLRWLSLGAALSVVPVLATFPLNRLLVLPSVGGSAIIAAVLVHGWSSASRAVRVGARVFFVQAVVLAIAWPLIAVIYRVGADATERQAMETGLSDEALGGRVFVFLAADPSAVFYPGIQRLLHGKPRPKAWISISLASHAHRLTRTSAREVELEVIDGRMMESVFEQLVRSTKHPIALGHRVQLNGASVEVIGLDEGLPNRLRVTFDEVLERSGFTFGQWEGERLMPMVLPAVGQSVVLPKPSGLLSL